MFAFSQVQVWVRLCLVCACRGAGAPSNALHMDDVFRSLDANVAPLTCMAR